MRLLAQLEQKRDRQWGNARRGMRRAKLLVAKLSPCRADPHPRATSIQERPLRTKFWQQVSPIGCRRPDAVPRPPRRAGCHCPRLPAFVFGAVALAGPAEL